MTSRPLYPEGVEIHASALQAGESNRRYDLQQRHVDWTQAGRVEGLVISIGSPSSRFSISSGRGYTPRGDLVSHDGVANLALADYSNGIENLVVLVYRELPGTPLSHESDGSIRNTLATASSEIKVMTRTEYDGLADNANPGLFENLEGADLTLDAKDRIVILAAVYGRGFTGPTPNGYVAGDFTNGLIRQQNYLSVLKTARIQSPPQNVTGLNFKTLSDDTPIGEDGSIEYNASTNNLFWTAPGEASSGAAVPVTMTAELEELMLTADGGSTLTVEVVPDLLPLVSVDDFVVVENFYDSTGPVFSGKDELHRSKKGSYLPTDVDPHGTGYQDLAQQVAVIDRTMLLGSGALANETQALLPRLLTPMSTAASVDRTLMWEMSGGSSHIRFYKSTTEDLEITVNASWNGTQWVLDLAPFQALRLSISNGSLSLYIYTGGTSPFATAAFSTIWESLPSSLLTLGSGLLGSAASSNLPRLITAFNTSGARVFILRVPPSSGGTPGYNIYASTGGLEVVVNATWNAGTSQWSQTDGSTTSLRLRFSTSRLDVTYKAAGAVAWADGSWDGGAGTLGSIRLRPSDGNIAAARYELTSTRTITRVIPSGGFSSGNSAAFWSFSPGFDGLPANGSLIPSVNGSSVNHIHASIEDLPEGAIITGLWALIFTGVDGGLDMQVYRRAKTGSSAPQSMRSAGGMDSIAAGVGSSGNPSRIALSVDAAVGIRTIDPVNYYYWAEVHAPTGYQQTAQSQFYGLEIQYTIAELGL